MRWRLWTSDCLMTCAGKNRDTIIKPKVIEVIAISEDGTLVSIMDEAWTFQFLPIVSH